MCADPGRCPFAARIALFATETELHIKNSSFQNVEDRCGFSDKPGMIAIAVKGLADKRSRRNDPGE